MIPIMKTNKIWNAFHKFATGQTDKSYIESYTIEEIKVTMNVFHKDSGRPAYKTMETRLVELLENDQTEA